MLKDWILRSSSQKYICKVVSIVGGVVVLAVSTVDKLTAFATVLWTVAPLLLLSLMDAGLSAEMRRCADLLKKNPTKDDPSVILWEGGDAGLFRFFRELISLSIWPFYLILFGLIVFGAEEITKSNIQAEAKEAEKIATVPQHYQAGNIPVAPARQTTFNQPPLNPAMQRFTPLPFATPPRFNVPARPATTPPKPLVTPPSSPASSPAPAVKNP
jgi:hypothetical protein